MEERDAAGAFNLVSAPANETGPVSIEKAIALFDTLADRSDIAFGYAADGCYARAHIMCQYMKSQGLAPEKAWAFEMDAKALCVKKPDSEDIEWYYHVAPVLAVRMPQGEVQELVFDPSLFDGPVTLKEWGDIMQASESQLQIKPFGVAPTGWTGDYDPYTRTVFDTDKWAAKTMTNYIRLQGSSQRVLFVSQERVQAAQGQSTGLRQQGITWISEALMRAPYSQQPQLIPSLEKKSLGMDKIRDRLHSFIS